MSIKLTVPMAALAMLTACTTTTEAVDPPAAANPDALCNAEAVQDYLGRTADETSGRAILKESGARQLRWGPPNAVWTMDLRPDRVNVKYDEASKITEISCG